MENGSKAIMKKKVRGNLGKKKKPNRRSIGESIFEKESFLPEKCGGESQKKKIR